jgi:hypothetical protein
LFNKSTGTVISTRFVASLFFIFFFISSAIIVDSSTDIKQNESLPFHSSCPQPARCSCKCVFWQSGFRLWCI